MKTNISIFEQGVCAKYTLFILLRQTKPKKIAEFIKKVVFLCREK
jgi:hypothetical protein